MNNFKWKGKLHFCGDIYNTEAWFILPDKNGKYVASENPHLNFINSSDKELKKLQKLNGKQVILTLQEAKE